MEHLHDQLSGDEAMYQEEILEHYRMPHNKGTLADATFSHRELNQSCGDTIDLYVRLDAEGRVADVKFDGSGCAISQASVSMLTDHVKGMAVDDLRKLTQDDVFRLLGITIGVTRLKCALLGLRTLEVGLQNHLNKS
jgi:nitrogen fixation NifU-like protein